MTALFPPTTRLQLPRYILLACTILCGVYLLLRSLDIAPFASNASLLIAPYAAHRGSRITKVTERIAPVNDLYEGSLRSHEEHDRLNGYHMRLYEEQVVDVYYNLATNLLAMIVEELHKPEQDRVAWLAWFSGDVVVLNPHIPLEIFLPPRDFAFINFLATRDELGFNAGVFFIRVCPWSVKMLLDVLSHGQGEVQVNRGETKHQKALGNTLRSDKFRPAVTYQPRWWYNAHASDHSADAKPGKLLVHFNSPDGDKWPAMAATIDQLTRDPDVFSAPLSRTTYPQDTLAYWNRLRELYALLPLAAERMSEEAVQAAVRRAQFAATYEADDQYVMEHVINSTKVAVGIAI